MFVFFSWNGDALVGLPWSKKITLKIRQLLKKISLPPNSSLWFRSVSSSFIPHPGFLDLKISRQLISSFSRPRLGHTLLSNHHFLLSLNSSPLCPVCCSDVLCELPYILFYRPSFRSHRVILFQPLSFLGYSSPDISLLLKYLSLSIISILIFFIYNAGLLFDCYYISLMFFFLVSLF